MKVLMAAVLASLLATGGAEAAGDVATGHQLAQRWCTGCHTVDAAGPARDTAPPFAGIAEQHKHDDAWLRGRLMKPHPPMPDLHLSRREMDDLIAYINSLSQP